ncbi:MAG: peptide chain release factor N(5)-glutamine methyltransferase [Ferruginibacter sp.]
MTVQEAYRMGLAQLIPVYGSGEADAMLKILLSFVTGLDKADMIRMPNHPLAPSIITDWNTRIEQLLRQVPIQYITGKTIFCGLELTVDPSVLIPRPETEELVLMASVWLVNHPKARVLDIGTGSGCIPISLKKKHPSVFIRAIDCEDNALQLARKNATDQETLVDFLQMDFLNQSNWPMLGKVDLLISNPPYIPYSEKKSLPQNVVAYEPAAALFVPDNDPLIFYNAIAAFGKTYLSAGGIILLECHEQYAHEVSTRFVEAGYQSLVINDLFDRARFVRACIL